MKTLASLLLLVTFGAATDAAAGGLAAPRSEAREHLQQARIAHGVASGQLTVAEARRLDRGQARVDAAQQAARADGHIGPGERVALARLQDRQRVRIALQKHDAQRRHP